MWERIELHGVMCEECQVDNYAMCAYCEDLIDQTYYGFGYLPDDWDNGTICPGCIEEKGSASLLGVAFVGQTG